MSTCTSKRIVFHVSFQDLSLYGVFTVKEMLNYYARVFSMSSDERKERAKFFINFLNLPMTNQLIMKMR